MPAVSYCRRVCDPEQLRKNAKEAQALSFVARMEMVEQYGLTRKELAAIEVEGVEKGWGKA